MEDRHNTVEAYTMPFFTKCLALVLALVLGSIALAAVVSPADASARRPRLQSKDSIPPSVPKALTVLSTTRTSISWKWNASADNVRISRYRVYRGTRKVGETSRTVFSVVGVACGSAVTLGVEAIDGAGNHSLRVRSSASTARCGDTKPPSAPRNLRTTESGATTIGISWSASNDNVAVTEYVIRVNGIASSRLTTTSAQFAGLACATAYDLSVEAIDAAGNRSPRARVGAVTSACGDATPPTSPTNVTPTGKTTGSISISWTRATDAVGVVGYGLYRSGTLAGTSSGAAHTFTGLACGTEYALAVDAYDAAGNRSAKGTVIAETSPCFDSTLPSAPEGLIASPIGKTEVTLTWAHSTDNVGVAGYVVYLGGVQAGQTETTSYTMSALQCGTTYSFGVEARDAFGNASARTSATTTTPSCLPPPSGGSGANATLSPSGNDANPCSPTAPCKSMQRGFAVSAAGGVVEMAGGSYPGQTLVDAHKSVTFRAAAGQTVRLSGALSLTCTTEITLDDVSAKSLNILAGNVGTRVYRGNYGGGLYNTNVEEDPLVVGDVGSCSRGDLIRDLVIDGAHVHDYMWQMDPGSAHPDCLQFFGGSDGVVIRNAIFERCADSFIGAYPDFGDIRNTTIENSIFRELGDRTYFMSQWGQPGHPGRCDGVIIRGNTFLPNNPGALGPYSSLRTECYGMTVENNTFQKGPGDYGCQVYTGFPWFAIWRNNNFLMGSACRTA